jgi:hypothetical protein
MATAFCFQCLHFDNGRLTDPLWGRRNLCDNPGFAVGLEHEVRGTIRKGAEWMVAWSHITVPVFTVLMRRSFGVGGSDRRGRCCFLGAPHYISSVPVHTNIY